MGKLHEQYNAIRLRLFGMFDDCDEEHKITLRELEKELAARPEERQMFTCPMCGCSTLQVPSRDMNNEQAPGAPDGGSGGGR